MSINDQTLHFSESKELKSQNNYSKNLSWLDDENISSSFAKNKSTLDIFIDLLVISKRHRDLLVFNAKGHVDDRKLEAEPESLQR